jgi:hypothetical protein
MVPLATVQRIPAPRSSRVPDYRQFDGQSSKTVLRRLVRMRRERERSASSPESSGS